MWHVVCALQCSSTCAGGFQRRVVVCQDADGRSNSYCDERVKPAESKSCNSGPCPLWNYGVWGEVRKHFRAMNTLFTILFHSLILNLSTVSLILPHSDHLLCLYIVPIVSLSVSHPEGHWCCQLIIQHRPATCEARFKNGRHVFFTSPLSAPRRAVEAGGLAWWCAKGPTAKGSTTTTVMSWTSRRTWSNATCSPARARPPGTADHGSRYDSATLFSSNTYLLHWGRARHCE